MMMVPNNALLEVLCVTESGIRVQLYAWASSLDGDRTCTIPFFFWVGINWMDRAVRNRPTIFAADVLSFMSIRKLSFKDPVQRDTNRVISYSRSKPKSRIGL